MRTPRPLVLLLAATLATAALAQGPDMRLDPAKAREYFPDVPLVNQDGETMRFYSDLIEGKSVVISVFFTSCVGVCPVLSEKIAALQKRLGDRLGEEVHLISISVDPETDTPQRLKAYAERFEARPGWYFLGGRKENVDWVLRKLGQYVTNKEGHSNILLVGNSRTGRWKKVFGLVPAEELLEAVEAVLNDDPA